MRPKNSSRLPCLVNIFPGKTIPDDVIETNDGWDREVGLIEVELHVKSRELIHGDDIFLTGFGHFSDDLMQTPLRSISL